MGLSFALGFGTAKGGHHAGGVFSNGLVAPTNLRNLSALGAAPLKLGFDWVAPTGDSVAGYRGDLHIASDVNFTTVTQHKTFLMDATAVQTLDESIGLVTPSGQYWADLRILRDNEVGITTVTDELGNTFNCDASPRSNVFTDTISVSVALLASATGANKSRYLNVASPFHQAISNNDVGSACCVRSSIAMAPAKGHFEFTIDGLRSTSTGAVNVGITDAATLDFNASGFSTRPGSGSNIPGVTVRCAFNATTLTIYRNGGNTTINTPGSVVIAQGDAIIFEVDNSAPATPTVAISYYRAATTTTTLLTTITMTGLYIPAAIWAFGATERGTGATTTFNTSDAFTFNPGYATFLSAASSGFNPYG